MPHEPQPEPSFEPKFERAAVARAVMRAARVDDAEAVAALIHLAGPEVYDFVFGPRRARVLDFICHEFRSGRGYGRFQNVQVLELDGEVVAAVSAYRAECSTRLFLGWLANVLGFYGSLRALPVLRRAWQARAVMNAPLPGGLYVSELGVAARWRSQGLGHKLMRGLIEQARQQGLGSVALSVARRDGAAQRFHAGLGFEQQAEADTQASPVPRALSPTVFMSLRLRP